jgi:uncharacterized protein
MRGMTQTVVGRLVSLWRYPVKSMAAQTLQQCDVSWHGLVGDRRWAFIRPGIERSGFPWLTIREKTDLWRYEPHFVDPSAPDKSETRVRTPTGGDHDVVDPALAAELGDGVRLIKQSVGVFDTFPLSLISQQSVNAIGGASGVSVTALRFRPNLLVETTSPTPFLEETWVGATVRIGGLRMHVAKRDGRCVMVNVDPATRAVDPRVLKTIAQHRDAKLGVYGSVVEPGGVRVGDDVILET